MPNVTVIGAEHILSLIPNEIALVFFGTVMVFGCTGSLLVICAILADKVARKRQLDIIALNLVVNDFLLCSFIAGSAFAVRFLYNPSGQEHCVVQGMFLTVLCTCSASLVLSLVVERYLVIEWVTMYDKLFGSWQKVWGQIVTTWVIQLAINIALYIFEFVNYSHRTKIYYCLGSLFKYETVMTIVVVASFSVCLIVTAFAYLAILTKQLKKPSGSLNQNHDVKLMYQQLVPVLSYFCSWGPVILTLQSPWSVHVDAGPSLAVFGLLFLGALVKPYWYLATNRAYRKQLCQLFNIGSSTIVPMSIPTIKVHESEPINVVIENDGLNSVA